MQLSPLEYRQTRASLRDSMSAALDALDAVQGALAHGHADAAHEHSLRLSGVADDITALCERIVRHVTYKSPE